MLPTVQNVYNENTADGIKAVLRQMLLWFSRAPRMGRGKQAQDRIHNCEVQAGADIPFVMYK